MIEITHNTTKFTSQASAPLPAFSPPKKGGGLFGEGWEEEAKKREAEKARIKAEQEAARLQKLAEEEAARKKAEYEKARIEKLAALTGGSSETGLFG